MKVNHVGVYVKKKVRFKKGQDTIVNYGKRLLVDTHMSTNDITDISEILLSYVHTEVSGGLVMEGFNRGMDDFDNDVVLAKDTFMECANRLHSNKINVDLSEIKQVLFDK